MRGILRSDKLKYWCVGKEYITVERMLGTGCVLRSWFGAKWLSETIPQYT